MFSNLLITALVPFQTGGEVSVYVDEILYVTAPMTVVSEFGIVEQQRCTFAQLASFGSAVNLRYTLREAALLVTKRPLPAPRLKQKLLSRGFPEQAVDTVLLLGKTLGWLDDLLLARSIISNRLARKHQGPGMLKNNLLQRGFDYKTVKQAVDDVMMDYQLSAMAYQALQKKYGKPQKFTDYRNIQRQKQKYFLFLHNRGFTSDASYEAIDRFLAEYRE